MARKNNNYSLIIIIILFSVAIFFLSDFRSENLRKTVDINIPNTKLGILSHSTGKKIHGITKISKVGTFTKVTDINNREFLIHNNFVIELVPKTKELIKKEGKE